MEQGVNYQKATPERNSHCFLLRSQQTMAIATLWNNIGRSDARAVNESVCEETQRVERFQY